MVVKRTSKAKPKTSGNEVVKLSAAEIAAKLKKKKSIFDRSKKKDAPVGYLKDEEVVKMFGLKPGKGLTQKAQLRNVEVVEFGEALIFKMKFVVYDGEHQGAPLQNDIWLNLDDDEKLEKGMDSIMFILQKLGYDTDELTIDQIGQLADELSEEKPYCVIYLSCYKVGSGKRKGSISYGVRVNSAFEPSGKEKDEDDEEDDEEDSEDEDEVFDSDEDDDSEDGDEDDGDDDSDESDEEDDEDSEGSEEEDEEFDEDDPSTWVGYVCKAKPAKAKRAGSYEVVSYNKRSKKLTISHVDSGSESQITPDEVIDWVEE